MALVSRQRDPARSAQPYVIDSGSSPVSSLNAIGIWRLRLTPSFCRSTSQWAFAVRGEIPSRAPTSSFEQPAAIRATTSRWRAVMGAAFFSVPSSIMAPRLLPRSRDDHSSRGVNEGVSEAGAGCLANDREVGVSLSKVSAARSRCRARRAPRWLQRLGLEWLHRLLHEPWRWRRMLALPRFAILVLRQRWTS